MIIAALIILKHVFVIGSLIALEIAVCKFAFTKKVKGAKRVQGAKVASYNG